MQFYEELPELSSEISFLDHGFIKFESIVPCKSKIAQFPLGDLGRGNYPEE